MKVFMPLYSLGAFGRFFGPYPFGSFYPGQIGYCIYQRRHTWHGIICIKEQYYTPYFPNTPKQKTMNERMRQGVSIWKHLTPTKRALYNNYTYPLQMSGYNKFLHYYLKGTAG